MENNKRKLLLSKQDYSIIINYIKKGARAITFNRRDAEELETELKKAKLVDGDELPEDVVRLNSFVTIKELNDNSLLEVRVVSPEKANIQKKWISIMSPIGTSLIGFRKGERVRWKVPAGRKIFTIVDVRNQFG